MGKYLELFLGEVGDLTEKTKLENKPYVCYSTKLGSVTYTVVPVKDPDVEGPANNEIWYTTTDNVMISRLPDIPKNDGTGNLMSIIEHTKTANGFKIVFENSLDGCNLGEDFQHLVTIQI